jgi:serine/threonine protein kinase/tetratricopeptide (TPR) repeat protein
MPVVPQQVKDLFLAAAEKVPAERSAFLDEACGADAELRRRVEQLLGAHDEPGSQPLPPRQTADEAPPAEPAEGVGAVVAGRYKLLQLLGEGGMGSVFMAEQTQPVKRMVALKVVKAGMDSKAVLGRFEAERQALALMDHPNIAKVLDAGTTERGQPFFVMDLVKGVPLTQFCDQRQLSVNDRLAVFQQICHAVQHAHQKGIIHRDLKPSNILVESHDGRAVPKVIDFGLAKAINAMPLTERSVFTQLGAMLGTPLYMAPEQAEFSAIDVDTRADIYALGVILYELLTGTTPLEKQRLAKAAWDEIRRVIKEEEPPKPSTRLSTSEARASVAAQRQSDPQRLGKYVRGDLDWIVMKALAKERDRRYQTANAFAADVERFLHHEPVSAGPPTLRYKLRKFVRRNRAAVAVAATLAVLLLLGAVGLIVGLVAIRAEQRRTAAALAAETQARKQTREALNAMTDDVIEKLFARQPQLGENERAFLRKVLGFYEAFAAENGQTQEARAAAVEGQFGVAKVRAFLGERREAVGGYQEAIRLLERLAADFPAEPLYRQELAHCHHNLGIVLRGLGKRPEAEAAYRQAMALEEKLVADFPAVPAHRQDLAADYNSLGILLKDLGKFAEAEANYRQALAIEEKLAADFPAELPYRQAWARSQANLATLLNFLGKPLDAVAAQRQALPLFAKLAADFPAEPQCRQELAGAHNNLSLLLTDLGRGAEAEAACRQALTLIEQLAADFPAVPAYREDLAGYHDNLGNLLRDLGKRPEAEAAYRHALALWEKLAADFPTMPAYRQRLACDCFGFGVLLYSQKRARDALEWYAKAIPLLQANLGTSAGTAPDRLSLRNAHANRALALADLHRYPEALQDWERAIELDEGPDRPAFRLQRAVALAHLGDHARASAEADDLTHNARTPAGTLYDAACVYGLSVPAAKDDAKQQEQYARKALALLRRAQAAGFFKSAAEVEHLKEDDDLAALRDRADFKQLVRELQKKLRPPTPPKP